MNKIILGACCLWLIANAPALAADADAGKKKSQTCAACHGPEGNTPTGPDFPRLAGQHYDYLVKSVARLQVGRAQEPDHESPRGQPYYKRDIEDLAAYFSSQQGLITSTKVRDS